MYTSNNICILTIIFARRNLMLSNSKTLRKLGTSLYVY